VILAAAALLLFGGLFFMAVAALGLLRLPDFYCRLHALGKCDTLGVAMALCGLALLEGFSLTGLKILAIVVFIFLANPTATHALARAALRAGLVPWTRGAAGPVMKEPR
jgi:multicomponent Na+:H+ antiporter subunit G